MKSSAVRIESHRIRSKSLSLVAAQVEKDLVERIVNIIVTAPMIDINDKIWDEFREIVDIG